MPRKAGRYDIFICHAGEQKHEYAIPLKELFEDGDCSVFLDETDLRVGNVAQATIFQALNSARVVVVIVSWEFIRKKYPMKELEFVLERYEDDDIAVLPYFVDSRLQVRDCMNPETLLKKYNREHWLDSDLDPRPDHATLEEWAGLVSSLVNQFTAVRHDQFNGKLERQMNAIVVNGTAALMQREDSDSPPRRRSPARSPPQRYYDDSVSGPAFASPDTLARMINRCY